MNKIIPVIIGLMIIFCIFVSIPIYVISDCAIFPAPIIIKLGLPWKTIPCHYNGIMWGKSVLEYGNDFKCLIDEQGFCFLHGSCKPANCDPTVEPQNNDTVIQEFIQNGCVSYFDGCNTCSVDESGRSMCTLMACTTMREPKCNKYKEIILPISSQESDRGWYYGAKDQKKPNTPENWTYTEAGRSSCWHKLNTQCGFLPD